MRTENQSDNLTSFQHYEKILRHALYGLDSTYGEWSMVSDEGPGWFGVTNTRPFGRSRGSLEESTLHMNLETGRASLQILEGLYTGEVEFFPLAPDFLETLCDLLLLHGRLCIPLGGYVVDGPTPVYDFELPRLVRQAQHMPSCDRAFVQDLVGSLSRAHPLQDLLELFTSMRRNVRLQARRVLDYDEYRMQYALHSDLLGHPRRVLVDVAKAFGSSMYSWRVGVAHKDTFETEAEGILEDYVSTLDAALELKPALIVAMRSAFS